VLSKLGDRVDRLRVPLVGQLRRQGREGRIWGVIVARVLRRPALSAGLAAAVMLALAAPALQLHMAPSGPDSFPRSLDIVKTYDRMQQAFPGTALPATIVVESADVRTPAIRSAIAHLEQRALASGRAFEPITVEVSQDATVASITVPIAGSGTDAASGASLRALRDEVSRPSARCPTPKRA
jgi:RND superfamily putative drug exporter